MPTEDERERERVTITQRLPNSQYVQFIPYSEVQTGRSYMPIDGELDGPRPPVGYRFGIRSGAQEPYEITDVVIEANEILRAESTPATRVPYSEGEECEAFTFGHRTPPEGCEVVLPEEQEIQLDLDTSFAVQQAKRAVAICNSHGVKAELVRTTRSRHGRAHMYVRFERALTPLERIALQACFASDPIRELLSLLRVWKGIENPSVMYEVVVR